jgi:hypothetical protein
MVNVKLFADHRGYAISGYAIAASFFPIALSVASLA